MLKARYLSRSAFIIKTPSAPIADDAINVYDYIKDTLVSCLSTGTLSPEIDDVYVPISLFNRSRSSTAAQVGQVFDVQHIVGRVLQKEYGCNVSLPKQVFWTDTMLTKTFFSNKVTVPEATSSRLSGAGLEGDPSFTDGQKSYNIPNEAVNLKEVICYYADVLGCAATTPDFNLVAQNQQQQVLIENINLTSACGGVYDFDITLTPISGGPAVYTGNFTQATLTNPFPFSTLGVGPGQYTFEATLDESPCGTGGSQTRSVVIAVPALASATPDIYSVGYNAASANYDIGANDASCVYGTTTWVEVSAISPAGPTSVLNGATGEITFQPGVGNAGEFVTEVAIACDGIQVNTVPITFNVAAPTATALPDVFTTYLAGSTNTFDASTNDTPCSAGATLYQVKPSGSFNASAVINDAVAGTFDITGDPGFAGDAIVQYEITCDGIVTAQSTITVTYEIATATAVNDTLPDQVVNGVALIDVSTNDTACGLGSVTTYEIVTNSAQGGDVVIDSVGNATFTPDTDYVGAAQFQYNILCDGVVADTATVSFNYVDNGPFLAAINGGTGVNPALIDTTGSLGNFVRVRLDQLSDTTYEFDSGWLTNTGVVTVETTGFEVVDGDTVEVCSATDNSGSNKLCGSCIVPDSGATFPANGADDMNAISIDITGTWGLPFPTYRYRIEYKDSNGDIGFTDTISSPTTSVSQTVDLLNEGMTDLATIDVTAFSGSCAEQDITTLDRCAAVNFVAIASDNIQTFLNNGNGTHTFNLNNQVNLVPFITDITGTTSIQIDASGSQGQFIRARVTRNGGTIYNSGYVSNTGSNLFNPGVAIQNGDVVEVFVASDASGTNAISYVWELPQTTSASVSDPTVSNFTFSIVGDWDTKVTSQEHVVEYYDDSNVLGHTETLTAPTTNYVIDLTGQGMATVGSIQIRTQDSKAQEATKFLVQVNTCANTEELDDLLIDYTPSEAATFIARRYSQDLVPELSPTAYAALIGAAGTTFRDPSFGTLIKVITTNGLNQVNSERVHWNIDQTLAFMKRNSSNYYIIDGQNGDLLYQRDIRYQGIDPTDGVRWHPTLTNVLYYPIGNQIIYYNVVTQAQTVAFTSPYGTLGTGNRRMAGGDGNDDKNGRILVSHGDKNTILQVINLANGNVVFDELQGSPGSYEWVKTEVPWDANSPFWNHPVSGVDFDYATLSAFGDFITTQVDGFGTEIYDFNGTKLGQLAPMANHMSQGVYDDNGVLKQCVTGKVTPGAVSNFPGSSAGDVVAVLFEVTTNASTGIRSLQTDYRIIVDWVSSEAGPGGGQYSQSSDGKNMLISLNPWEPNANSFDVYFGEIQEASMTDEDPALRRIVHSMINTASPVAKQPEAWLRPDGKAMIYKSDIKGQYANNGYLFFVNLPERTCVANR